MPTLSGASFHPDAPCAPRGPKEWFLVAKGLSQAQRRALGVRAQGEGYPASGPSTFWRRLSRIDGDALENNVLQVQAQLRGPAPPDELIVLDGKQPRHGGGHPVLTAATCASPASAPLRERAVASNAVSAVELFI